MKICLPTKVDGFEQRSIIEILLWETKRVVLGVIFSYVENPDISIYDLMKPINGRSGFVSRIS